MSEPAEFDALLRERARALARPLRSTATRDVRHAVSFRLAGGMRLALDLGFVREVLRPLPLVRLPGAPPALAGLALLRGEPLTVVELSPLLGLAAVAQEAAAAGTAAGSLLVLGSGEAPELALQVAAVEDLLEVDRARLLPPPAAGDSQAHAPATGWVDAVDPDGILFLDGKALLGAPELVFDFPA